MFTVDMLNCASELPQSAASRKLRRNARCKEFRKNHLSLGKFCAEKQLFNMLWTKQRMSFPADSMFQLHSKRRSVQTTALGENTL